MTIRNGTITIFPLMALLAVGVVGCGSPEQPKTSTTVPKEVTADVLTVEEAPVAGGYEATGSVKAQLNATLSSKVMGRVVTVGAKEGDAVSQGKLLVSLDPRELQAAVSVATANYRSAMAGIGSAAAASEMENRTSRTRILQAQSQVAQAQAALSAAQARRDLTLAGPRTQEVTQAHLAVVQAGSNLELARKELSRATTLVQDGALAQRELDLAQNRCDLAKGQYDVAVQSENIAREGSRSQDVRASQDMVAQARAAVMQARAGLVQARAAALQTTVRRQDIAVAKAQAQQAAAGVQSARVSLSYAQVSAPFDGQVVQRMVDPGSMAMPGSPLLAVEGGQYRLEAVVPEDFLKSVALGDAISVQIDALRHGSATGRVVEIVPTADPATHSFMVKIALPTSLPVRSGMYGRATIRTSMRKHVFIPETSTWEREGLHYVYALNKEDVARLRIVTLGDRRDGKYEVLSGLNAGDRIVVGDRSAVTDGVKVEAKPR